MPDRVVLQIGEATVDRHSRQARVVVPYAGARAHLHLYAAEIAGELRAIATDPSSIDSLFLVAVEFGAAAAELEIAGPVRAVEHWLEDDRLLLALAGVIDRVHDERLIGG